MEYARINWWPGIAGRSNVGKQIFEKDDSTIEQYNKALNKGDINGEKYTLLKDDFTELNGVKCYRIKYLKDVYSPFGQLLAQNGDLGGYITPYALSQEGGCVVLNDAIVCGGEDYLGAFVVDNAIVKDQAVINYNLPKNKRNYGTINHCIQVSQEVRIANNAQINGHAITIRGNAQINGNALILGKYVYLNYEQNVVRGNAVIKDNVIISSKTTLEGWKELSGKEFGKLDFCFDENQLSSQWGNKLGGSGHILKFGNLIIGYQGNNDNLYKKPISSFCKDSTLTQLSQRMALNMDHDSLMEALYGKML